jgi:bacteriorhodopsin
MNWPWWAVALATAPVLLLTVLVLRSRPVTRSAWLAAGVAGIVSIAAF